MKPKFHGKLKGGEITKKKILSYLIICTLLSLVGYGSEQNDMETKDQEDVVIEQSTRYYSNDAIVIKSYNDYQCVDTSLSYNEETGIYTCTVDFKKIINKDGE